MPSPRNDNGSPMTKSRLENISELIAGSLCILAVLSFVSHDIAYALPYASGQVFASVGNDEVNVFTPDGALVQTLNTLEGVVDGAGFTTGSTFDAAGNFYVTNFSANTVSKFDNAGTLIGAFSDPSLTALSPESIVLDKSANAYVGYADGDRDIRKFSPTGHKLTQYNVATENRGSGWIDLAADQHTMFYTSEGRLIKRFDVGTNMQLSDFATLPGVGMAFALRLLPDDGLLVVDELNVKRLNSSGVVVKTYDAPGEDEFLPLTLDPDNTTFWTGGRESGEIYRFNIATGDLIKSFSSQPFLLLGGLSVFGQPPPVGGPVPEPSTITLFMTGLGGLFLYKRRLKAAA